MNALCIGDHCSAWSRSYRALPVLANAEDMTPSDPFASENLCSTKAFFLSSCKGTNEIMPQPFIVGKVFVHLWCSVHSQLKACLADILVAEAIGGAKTARSCPSFEKCRIAIYSELQMPLDCDRPARCLIRCLEWLLQLSLAIRNASIIIRESAPFAYLAELPQVACFIENQGSDIPHGPHLPDVKVF